MTIETDAEFDAGTSPCINTDPRLPRQHTLDAHQLRVLHRAIDTLAFVAKESPSEPTGMQINIHGSQIPSRPNWVHALHALANAVDDVATDMPHMGNLEVQTQLRGIAEDARRAMAEPTPIPRGVSELIDATVGAWEPVKDELVAQTVQFQHGESLE